MYQREKTGLHASEMFVVSVLAVNVFIYTRNKAFQTSLKFINEKRSPIIDIIISTTIRDEVCVIIKVTKQKKDLSWEEMVLSCANILKNRLIIS